MVKNIVKFYKLLKNKLNLLLFPNRIFCINFCTKMEILCDSQGTTQNSKEIVGRENRKLTTNCKVCGQKCLHYHYYGVRTCHGGEFGGIFEEYSKDANNSFGGQL